MADETANYYFIQEFSLDTDFSVYEPRNELAENIIHPRSINVYNASLVPVTYLGFPLLFGITAKVLGSAALLLTPLLAVLFGVVFFYFLKEFFSIPVAGVSAMAYFVAAPVLYFSQFVALQNTAFVSFVLFGVAALWFGLKQSKNKLLALSGLCLGIAVSMRVHEIVWIAFAGAGPLFCFRHSLSVKKNSSFTAYRRAASWHTALLPKSDVWQPR